jgi:hypothetical protein
LKKSKIYGKIVLKIEKPLKKAKKACKSLKNTTFYPCHLKQSPNTTQRTPIGVLFALAGALVCRALQRLSLYKKLTFSGDLYGVA